MTDPFNVQAPYTPQSYSTISEAWNAPVPEAAEITAQLAATIIGVSIIATPALMMHYGCGMDIFGKDNINKCFRNPKHFFCPPIIVGILVGVTLSKARDLSYRASHIVQTSAYRGYRLITAQ